MVTPPATGSVSDQPAAPGGDDFDSLLRLAEEDVSQLTQVRVSENVPALDTVVSTVSRTSSTVGKSPAAVFVITNEMIRRSGATCIPEVLRMAPGVNVARVSSDHWAVSIRGFNAQYANKLLVQIDGRTIYAPLFGGVFWAAQDVLLEDVERIEVIRGPGASVWGANAVNGVINIITKTAANSSGAYVQAGAGNVERGFVSARYGGRIGEDLDYRVYGKWFERGTGIPSGGQEFDDWRSARGGFRVDWDPGRTGCDQLTLQGDVYETPAGVRNIVPLMTPPFVAAFDTDEIFRGSNVLARWKHVVDEDRDWQVQAYYDFTQFNTGDGLFSRENRDTFDLDFQHRFPLSERQNVVWGAGYRLTSDDITYPSFPSGFTTPQQDVTLLSYFLQDEISLVPDRWTATLGCKFLHNTYTNFEYQPTARLLFTPNERQSLWLSVSRAVRTPSRVEESLVITLPPNPITPIPIFPQVIGNDQLVSEDLLAWELGYRAQPDDYFSWDAALFFNQYEDLIAAPPGLPQFVPFGILLPLQYQNASRAQSYGFELAANLNLTESWQLRGVYSFLRLDILEGPSNDPEGQSPRNQFYVQSTHDLGRGLELDLVGRYTDSLPVGNVPAYFVGDVRLAWRASKDVEWFVVGRSLFDDGHYEFGNSESIPTGVRNEVYSGVTIWR